MKKTAKTGAAAKVAATQTGTKQAVQNNSAPAMKVVKAEEPAKVPAPAEKSKAELKRNVVVRNVDATENIVQDLYTRVVHRRALTETINRFDKFTFNLKDNVDHDKENYYTGCTVTIKDSKGNEFFTRNPKLVQKVALFTRNLCVDKLGEIEAEIVLPAA
ncbi:hypothetical protein [Chitinophaga niabensis]|uniref:Uncharacterized protein n=1 Tax=Chitinophaga niabensis TaxID=536979 RepID=A0A1N6E2Q4_9BACT|nr:hypothetical protein [Chitinophaga niabensis]SIN77299.1 hypothetical protein SAMN04488055_1259 [Chitinophaga niabensis]